MGSTAPKKHCSRWRHCVQFDLLEIWTPDLPHRWRNLKPLHYRDGFSSCCWCQTVSFTFICAMSQCCQFKISDIMGRRHRHFNRYVSAHCYVCFSAILLAQMALQLQSGPDKSRYGNCYVIITDLCHEFTSRFLSFRVCASQRIYHCNDEELLTLFRHSFWHHLSLRSSILSFY